jgi:uncharacterized protein (TIGR02588 family)
MRSHASVRELGETRPSQDRSRSTAEWVTLSVSIAILALLIGSVVYVSFTGSDEPATIGVRPEMEEMRRDGATYYLPVQVTNKGGHTAEDVQVQLTLASGEGESASATFTIRFLAGGEQKRGVVAFQTDPTAGELRSSVSFIEP